MMLEALEKVRREWKTVPGLSREWEGGGGDEVGARESA